MVRPGHRDVPVRRRAAYVHSGLEFAGRWGVYHFATDDICGDDDGGKPESRCRQLETPLGLVRLAPNHVRNSQLGRGSGFV